MNRRAFTFALGGAASVTPFSAHGQDTRSYRLGLLNPQGRSASNLAAFFDELHQLGFVEGQNLIVDGRGYAARTEQFPALAVDLARRPVAASNGRAVRPLRRVGPALRNTHFQSSLMMPFSTGG